MPWTPSQFKARHAKHLTSGEATKAASVANAMLRGGADEGVAIATAIKRAKKNWTKCWGYACIRRTAGSVSHRDRGPREEKIR